MIYMGGFNSKSKYKELSLAEVLTNNNELEQFENKIKRETQDNKSLSYFLSTHGDPKNIFYPYNTYHVENDGEYGWLVSNLGYNKTIFNRRLVWDNMVVYTYKFANDDEVVWQVFTYKKSSTLY